MQDITDKLNTLKTRTEFIEFIQLLIADLNENAESWKNNDLPSYLNALANWTDDMNGYYTNMGLKMPDNIDWKVFANILIAARIYE